VSSSVAHLPYISVVVPTKDRPEYLKTTLESLNRQEYNGQLQILVVDDSNGDVETASIAKEFDARYGVNKQPKGLNAARNYGIEHTDGELVLFLDDDIYALPNLFTELASAVQNSPDYSIFAGRIVPKLEGNPLRLCKRNEPLITALNLDEKTYEAEFAWGANMAIRRSAFVRFGLFDEQISGCGDEEEWQRRAKASGESVRYLHRSAVLHRRSAEDSKVINLMRASYYRGRNAFEYDLIEAKAPSLSTDLQNLLGCIKHTVMYRCSGGAVQSAHAAGRLSRRFRE